MVPETHIFLLCLIHFLYATYTVFDRPMTMGEIGCFLSHYFIWKDMIDKGYKEIIVFEDDLRFLFVSFLLVTLVGQGNGDFVIRLSINGLPYNLAH